MSLDGVNWPDGRDFAFTIFDDTDFTTLETGPPVYDLLTSLGIRATKSVWPVAPTRPRTTGGATCDDPEHLTWVRSLQAAGHEIGFHNATDHPSPRAETIAALDRFRELFGHDPAVGADHAANREALYWGPKRLTGARAAAYRAVQRVAQPHRPPFSGEEPDSPYFWGDVCRERIRYWRSFTFAETDLLAVTPRLPYHDPARPFVAHWFTSTHAPTLAHLVARLDDAEIDRLEARGGVCIVYAHLGLDVAPGGVVDPAFERAVTRLSQRNAWFAPVSEVLDHLVAQQPSTTLTDRERRHLELAWIRDRLRSTRRIGPRTPTHAMDGPDAAGS